jgi:peptidoglycan glycosyltransferase
MNSRIRRLAVGLMLCYVALFASLQLPQVFRAEELNAHPGNTRQIEAVFDRPRGPIITADGVVVAETVLAPEGDRFTFQRRYPTADLFAHITGYFTFANGATQVERQFNDVLAGRTGRQRISGLPDLIGGERDNSGTVELTLRADYQRLARQLLGEREGSIVVMDPRSGAVLAMWSWPSFDPNQIADHNTEAAANALLVLNADKRKPLLANAYQERYAPGSTFKVVTTTTALKAGIVTPDTEFEVERSYTPPQTNDPIENFGGNLCGGDLRESFRRSCNTVFARLAVELGGDRFTAGADAFGLNEAPPIDLPRPAASFVHSPGERFEQNLPILAQRGFGSESVQITPLQMAMIASSVANDGQMMAPYVVERTIDHDGATLTRTQPRVWKTPMSQEIANTMTELMIGVVNGPRGTAQGRFDIPGVQVAAKTGTAQLNPKGAPERSHAWITAFAPAENPRVSVAVVLKGVNAEISAGTGGRLAGPIANEMLKYALTHP